MSWDIRSDQESKSLEFMAHELAPTIQRLGITPTDAWYTVYGNGPQITLAAVSDLNTIKRVLVSPDWHDLMEKLSQYALDFTQRIVTAKGRLQL